MRYFKLFVPAILLALSVNALAQGTTAKAGRAPTAEEIQAWDIDVSPEGKGLPPGKGTVAEGALLYAQKCAKCHGRSGEQQIMGPGFAGAALVPRRGPNNTPAPEQPFATVYWDHINRAMPRYEESSLTHNQVYSLTAYLLYMFGLIKETDVMDANTLPKVQMPNRDSFLRAPSDLKKSLSCDPWLSLRCVEYWKAEEAKAKK